MNDNLASIVSRVELGHRYYPYRPSYSYAGDYVDDAHAALGASDEQQALLNYQGVDGFLRVADALKLYELAFFASGDVLEIGTHHGLSAAICATAIQNSELPSRRLHTVELSPASVHFAQANHQRLGVAESICYHVQPSNLALTEFASARKRFSFVFVDHDHSFEATRELLARLDDLLVPCAFVLFHDYNDVRNTDPNDFEYGVFDALEKHAPNNLQACGTFGCCGLFRYTGSTN